MKMIQIVCEGATYRYPLAWLAYHGVEEFPAKGKTSARVVVEIRVFEPAVAGTGPRFNAQVELTYPNLEKALAAVSIIDFEGST